MSEPLSDLRRLILDTVSPVPRPKLPTSLQTGRIAEVGPAYKMSPRDGEPGSLLPVDYHGTRGQVVAITRDGDVELELGNGRGVFVHHARVRTIRYTDGEVLPSLDERRLSRARGGVL